MDTNTEVTPAEAPARTIIREIVRLLTEQASQRFSKHGPADARGAALWDAARFLDPDDGNALNLPPVPCQWQTANELTGHAAVACKGEAEFVIADHRSIVEFVCLPHADLAHTLGSTVERLRP